MHKGNKNNNIIQQFVSSTPPSSSIFESTHRLLFDLNVNSVSAYIYGALFMSVILSKMVNYIIFNFGWTIPLRHKMFSWGLVCARPRPDLDLSDRVLTHDGRRSDWSWRSRGSWADICSSVSAQHHTPQVNKSSLTSGRDTHKHTLPSILTPPLTSCANTPAVGAPPTGTTSHRSRAKRPSTAPSQSRATEAEENTSLQYCVSTRVIIANLNWSKN